MPTLAFWNVGRNVDVETIVAFALEWDVDILLLAENKVANNKLVTALNSASKRFYFPDVGNSDRLTILTRFNAPASALIRDTFGISIRHYEMPLRDSLLVVAVHLASKLHLKTEEQVLGTARISRYVREAEDKVGHSRTVFIGDLNMNPFEAGVVGSDGLHAIVDRRIAADGARTVQGESCKYFYNPMWSMLGDLGSEPPGTYFYNSGSPVNYFWNIFDQVLLRPSLINSLIGEGVKIVTKVAGRTLLGKHGRPNTREGSDHLPVICRLAEAEETMHA
jgi:hypothetical protein